MARVALDAGVVIGLLDPRDAHHRSARRAFAEHAGDDLRMPVSAYAEVLASPAREGRLEDVKQEISKLGIAIDAIDAPIAERAASLRAERKALLLADAFVLAYADVVAADRVLTTDRRLARLAPSVQLVR